MSAVSGQRLAALLVAFWLVPAGPALADYDTGIKAYRILEEAPPLMQETFVERFSSLHEWEQSMILSALQRLVSLMDAKAIEAAPFLATSTLNPNNEQPGAKV